MMGVLTLTIGRKTSTCSTLPSRPLDMAVFCRLDGLGLVAVGERLAWDRAVIECRVAEPDPVVPGLRQQGALARDGHATARA